MHRSVFYLVSEWLLCAAHEYDCVLTDCAPGFAAVRVQFISTDGTSFECSWSDKYGCYWSHITRTKFVIRSPTRVFNCPAFSESCCFWVQSSLCEPRLNANIAFLSLPNMVIQTKNSVVLYSWVLTEGSLWVNLVLYNSRWQRCEADDRRDKTHVNRILPFPLLHMWSVM